MPPARYGIRGPAHRPLYGRRGFDLVLAAIALTGFVMMAGVYVMAAAVNGAEAAAHRAAQPAE